MAMLIASLCAEGTSTIGNVGADRPWLRADRRASARARRPHRARRRLTGRMSDMPRRRAGARVVSGGSSRRSRRGCPCSTTCSSCSRAHARLDLALEVAPGGAATRSPPPGRALGEALLDELLAAGARGYGSAVVPADEALAARRARGVRPAARRLERRPHGGPRRRARDSTSSAAFLRELAEGAGLTLHVRLIEGDDTAARARRDLQGPRRRARAGVPARDPRKE